MSMMQEIEKLMGDVGLNSNFRIINFGGNALYVEGVKAVVCVGEREMRFQLKKQLLIVTGEELKVKYLDKTTCVLAGLIMAVQTL